MSEKEVFQSNEVTCPHCGFEDSDSIEYGMDSKDWNNWSQDLVCGACLKEFHVEREVEVSYTSDILKENNETTV